MAMKARVARRISLAPDGPDVGDFAALAKRVGHVGEAMNGPHLIAQEYDRDAQQN